MNRRLVLMGAAAFLVATPGCKKHKEKEVAPSGVKVGLVLPDSSSPYYQAMKSGIQKIATDRQYELVADDAQGKASEQTRIVEQYVQKGINVLLVSAIDAEKLKPTLEKATGQKIYVVALERPLADMDVSTSITFDQELAGRLLADYLGNQLKSGGKVGVITGGDTPGEKKRLEAFQSYLREKYPSIQVADQETARGEAEQTGAVQRLLSKNSGLKAVVALNPQAGIAAAAAAGSAAGKPFVVTYGGNPKLIAELKKPDSPLQLVLEPLPQWVGDRAGRVSWRIVSNKPTPSSIELPVQPLTRDNLDTYHGWDGVIPENMLVPWKSDLVLELKREE